MLRFFCLITLITIVLSGTTAKCESPDNPPGCTPPPECDGFWDCLTGRRSLSLSEHIGKYHCARFTSELSTMAECSTISPLKFVGNDYTNVDAIESWAESQVKYWCCRMQKDTRAGLMRAAVEFSQMCWSNHVLLHAQDVFEKAIGAEKEMLMFSDLVIYCPSRFGAKTNVDFRHLEKVIRKNLNGGSYVPAEATCEDASIGEKTKTSGTGTFTVVLDLETGTSQFGHMVGFFGDIEDLNQENYVSWGPSFLDVDSESFDLLIGGKGKKQPIEIVQVSEAIQFTGVDVEQMKQAWKAVQENAYYSLLDFNCVSAIWEILMPQLNCKSREADIFFSVPTRLFKVLLQVGAETGSGQQIDEQQKIEMTNKFRTMATQTNDRRKLSTSDSLNTSSRGFSNTMYMYASVGMMFAGMFLVGFEISRRCYKL